MPMHRRPSPSAHDLTDEVSREQTRELGLDVLHALPRAPALLDDLLDALGDLGRARAERRGGAREERVRGAEVVQQARAREEVEPRGGGARARERLGVWEEEELEVVDRGEVRAAAAGVGGVLVLG